eukprot:jgi/Mesvir1/19011/Mv12779-RA.1
MAAAVHASLSIPCSKSEGFGGVRLNAPAQPRRVAISRPVPIECKESRIGKKAVVVPPKVTINIADNNVHVKGPLGELHMTYPVDKISLTQAEGKIKVLKVDESRSARQLHGLFRTLINNAATGVSTGFTKSLLLEGVGYRASSTAKELTLNLGYSHPVVMAIPPGIKVECENKGTKINVTGFSKEAVGTFTAIIRSKREPEPYLGKGVRYADEVIRRKEGKSGKK